MSGAERYLSQAVAAFEYSSPVTDVRPISSGHVNNTFCVHTAQGTRYVLQRINSVAFHHPDEVMDNALRITEHLRREILCQGGDSERGALHFLSTKTGESFFTDPEGEVWRVYPFVERTICLQAAETPELFAAAARAFGKFQCMLQDFPADTLHETIPRFHDTPNRLSKLKEALAADRMGRAAEVQQELNFALSREKDCSVAMDALSRGELPLRVTHNDTKLNNVLLDEVSGEGVCVIDLDTVMPGLSINDFGDAIRFGANHCAEDEKDLSKVNFDLALFEIYTRGYLQGTNGSLTENELAYLPWGAKLMTLECGIRFLTDYLEGDVYFHTSYSGQNLDRCRTQFKLVADMEQQWSAMEDVIRRCQ